MKKQKCYIAGKIGGLSENEYLNNFAIARVQVTEMGYTPVCPTLLPHNHDKKWESYMKEDVKAMLDCELVYAQRNWRHSIGATEEIRIATMLGINIIHQK
jgi:alkyl hydroperoxide reductase subunit AhpC